MESDQNSSGSSNLTRRDFMKFLPLVGGGFLLAQCDGSLTPVSMPTLSPTPSYIPPSVSPPLPDGIPSASPVPLLDETSTLTPQPLTGYLPKADGSFSTFLLPEPQFLENMPLRQALQERHSDRTFRLDEITTALISSVLWAGFGINRSNGKRTAPSANNVQDIDIYLVTGKGLFRYMAANHHLIPLLPDDLRPFSGTQEFVFTAPLNLVYVSDYNRIQGSIEDCLQWSWAHSGCIAQNVSLACAALGLATVVRSSLDRLALGLQMGLNPDQHITLAQTIGYHA